MRLRWEVKRHSYRHTFFPLVYLMTKEGESAGAAIMLMMALQMLAVKYFDEELLPGAGILDHTSSFRTGYMKVFPGTPLAQCWPHLARKLREGHDYISKKHEKAEDAKEHCRRIHMAHTAEQRNLLMDQIGKVCVPASCVM